MMKNLKKFFVFAIATAIVAGAVFFISPGVKSFAEEPTSEGAGSGGGASGEAGGETGGETGGGSSESLITTAELKLTAEAARVYVGGWLDLRATLVGVDDPTNSLINSVQWYVKDTSIVRIWHSSGPYFSVQALKPGSTTIYARVDISPTISVNATCDLTIPTESSKQNATPAKSSSSAATITDLSKPGAEVVLPATITTSDGKPMSMFTSTDGSQTMMAGATDLIPSGSKLQAVEAAPTSQTFSVAKAIMAAWKPNAEVKKVYDFNVFSKQATLIKTLDNRVCMSLPMPADLTVPEGMVLKVYKFNDDGSIIVCETLIDQGRVVWGTDSFGTFAFVVEKAPKARR